MLRENFTKGIMNMDADERLLPDGEHREALNINVVNSEGSDVGAIENSLSNKKLTNIRLGPNPKTIGWLEDEAEDKIYWLVKTNTGCFLIEWDDINQVSSLVLMDTRPIGQRVLDLSEDHLITGIVKVISEDSSEDLLMWTDNNMEPCSINIERAKTWGANNFDIEDILLIKKPPRYAPVVIPTYVNDSSNNLEDKFLSISYRFKYRDGEYSALSDFSSYAFYPKPFNLDYYTLENKGMISSYNGMLIKFNSGDKRVTDIQIVAKYSNSNSLYIVETFNKSNLSWEDNETKQTVFSNDKIYMQMDSDQLKRAFDNVPLKAKALALIGNIPVFGNYLEGRDIVGPDDKLIPIDYTLVNITDPITTGDDFEQSVQDNVLKISNPKGIVLSEVNRLTIYFSLALDGIPTYDSDFFFILDQDYTSLDSLFSSDGFKTLIEVMNSSFLLNYNSYGGYDVKDGWVVETPPTIKYENISGQASFVFSPVIYKDTFNEDALHTVAIIPNLSSYASISESVNSTSVKTNRSVSVGIVYQDEFNRRTTVLASPYNSLFIPQKNSIYKNSIRATINSKPPVWADRYKLVVKSQPLSYQTIFVNAYYNEDSFVWCKLEAENKDKVKVGDVLIVKYAAGETVYSPIEVKVLDVEKKEKDFLEHNVDSDGISVIEQAGTYMKIRVEGFSMDFEDQKILQSVAPGGRSNAVHPLTFLPLFTTIENDVVVSELSIPAGSSIRIKLESSRHYNAGKRVSIHDETYYAQRDYDTLEDWMNENFVNKYIKGERNDGSNDGKSDNYQDFVALKRGYIKNVVYFGKVIIEDNDPTKRGLFLSIKGLFSGGTTRYGRVSAEINIRTSQGFYVFETKEKQADNDIYYETEQCFDIKDGNHLGNVSNQDVNDFTPAVVDLDFFNCYTQGNGVESYRVKDSFNTNFLNIDLRPSTTSVEQYKAIRRFADLTFGGPFAESSGINKLNEFNIALGNWKELDKQYGSIQRLESRESDLLVIQENKASRVLFGKDLINTADGNAVLTSSSDILGQQVPFAGENGIGLNPESFAKDVYRCYWVNPMRGTPIRLSMDGTTEINYGMISFFRDLFIKNPTSRKIGGFDPYHRQYFVSIDDEIQEDFITNCGNSVYKTVGTTPFVYYLKLNELSGDIIFNYSVTNGLANIVVEFDGVTHEANNVGQAGNITFPRTSMEEDMVKITLSAPSQSADIEITSTCPIGTISKVASIVLCDKIDEGTIMKNKYRWGSNPFYEETHLFSEGPISKFTIEQGNEGSTKFPKNGETINIQAYKDGMSTGSFDKDKCNRIGYLVSPITYSEADIEAILSQAAWLNLNETQLALNSFVHQSNFVLNKENSSDILYLIWDYVDRRPIGKDYHISTPKGSVYNLNVLEGAEIEFSGDVTVEIVSQPKSGIAVVNLDNTITYTHNGADNYLDDFTYIINSQFCSSEIYSVQIDIAVQCDGVFNYNGNVGTFSFNINFGDDMGICGISYDAYGIPDAFEIEWDGNIVATTGGLVSNQGNLTFNKNKPTPRNATVTVSAPNAGTAWNIKGICPVPGTDPEPEPEPEVPLMCDEMLRFTGAGGVTTKSIDFGPQTGSCGISYEIRTGVAQINIQYDGQTAASTGIDVSGSGTLTFNKNSVSPVATFTITARSDADWTINPICLT